MGLTVYYLLNVCFQGILCIFFIVQLGKINPGDPRSKCFRRSLYGVVAWAFFDFLICFIKTGHSSEAAFTAYRYLCFLFLAYPPLGFELILSLIRKVTWKNRICLYLPYLLLYVTALTAPHWLNARIFGITGGYDGAAAPWNLAFKVLTLTLATTLLGLLLNNARNETLPVMRKEKLCLFYGGSIFLAGIIVSQILKISFGPDIPWFANLFSSALSLASFVSLRYYGRVLSPEMLYEATLKIVPGGIFHLRENRITWYNNGLTRITGDLPDPVAQTLTVDDILYPEQDSGQSPKDVLRTLLDETRANTLLALRHTTGAPVMVMGSSAPIHRGAPDRGHVVLCTDISERVAMEKALQRANRILEEQANNDALTGIANRRRFDTILSRELKRIQRVDSCLSLIMIDIDHFKAYNDCYGHQKGDDCLRVIARAIRACADRPGDLACRYGGEEIAVILPDTPAKGGLSMAEKIRATIMALEIPHKTSPVCGTVTCSMGVSTMVSGDRQNSRDLVNEADEALYKAKTQGRNRVVAFSISLT